MTELRYPGLSQLAALLDDVYPLTGVETLVRVIDDVEIYVDPYGSIRFRLVIDDVPVAGMQLMVKKDLARVANVYTHPDHRRKGHMLRLLRTAVTFVGCDVTLSDDRSEDGKQFCDYVIQNSLDKVETYAEDGAVQES